MQAFIFEVREWEHHVMGLLGLMDFIKHLRHYEENNFV